MEWVWKYKNRADERGRTIRKSKTEKGWRRIGRERDKAGRSVLTFFKEARPCRNPFCFTLYHLFFFFF